MSRTNDHRVLPLVRAWGIQEYEAGAFVRIWCGTVFSLGDIIPPGPTAGGCSVISSERRVLLGNQCLEPREGDMQFRLTYEGRLKSGASASPEHKHEIRRVFHRQLRQLWSVHPFFKEDKAWEYEPPRTKVKHTSRKTQLGEIFSRCGYKFVPIASKDLLVHCSLDILFLRPDPPGQLLTSGDIDNRVKTLLDALKMPNSNQDLGSYLTPEGDENPFFVLLEDDGMVTRLAVETDMLLQPTSDSVGQQDARLVISVSLTPYQAIWGNMGI